MEATVSSTVQVRENCNNQNQIDSEEFGESLSLENLTALNYAKMLFSFQTIATFPQGGLLILSSRNRNPLSF